MAFLRDEKLGEKMPELLMTEITYFLVNNKCVLTACFKKRDFNLIFNSFLGCKTAQCFEIHPNYLTVPTLQNETILVDFQTLCNEWTISTTILPLVFLSFNLIKLYSLNLLLRNAAVVLFCTCVLCYSQTSFWATF